MHTHANSHRHERIQSVREHCTPFEEEKEEEENTFNRKTIIATEICVLNSSDFHVFMCICLETSNE